MGIGIAELMDGSDTAVVACDAEMKVVYANPKCKAAFKELLHMENFVGNHMSACHKPETMTKLEAMFQEFRDKKRKLNYYVMDVAGNKLTVVAVPSYAGNRLTGVVEFVFEGSLG